MNDIVLDSGVPTFIHATWANPADPSLGFIGVIYPLGATIECGHIHRDVQRARECIVAQYPGYNPYDNLHHPCNPACALHAEECWNA